MSGSQEQDLYLYQKPESRLQPEMLPNAELIADLTRKVAVAANYFGRSAESQYDEMMNEEADENDFLAKRPSVASFEVEGKPNYWIENSEIQKAPFFDRMKNSFLGEKGVTELYIVGPAGSGKGMITSQLLELTEHDRDMMSHVEAGKGDILYFSLAKSYDYLISKNYFPNEWRYVPERIADNEKFMGCVRAEIGERYKNKSVWVLNEMVGALPGFGETIIKDAVESDAKSQVYVAGVSPEDGVVQTSIMQRAGLKEAAQEADNENGTDSAILKANEAFAQTRTKVHLRDDQVPDKEGFQNSQQVKAVQHSSADDTTVLINKQLFIERMADTMLQRRGGHYSHLPPDEARKAFIASLNDDPDKYTSTLVEYLNDWAQDVVGIKNPETQLYVEINEFQAGVDTHMFHNHLQQYFMPKDILDAAYNRFIKKYVKTVEDLKDVDTVTNKVQKKNDRKFSGTISFDQGGQPHDITP